MDDRPLVVDLGDRSYPIHIVPGLPGAALRALMPGVMGAGARSVLVVTDDNVGPLYAAEVAAALRACGARAEVFTLPAGEAGKTLAAAGAVVDAALAHGLLRDDLVVALGGGVIGDIAGFAAAVLHRGVRFVQVPTTLLAQVDSSVGGKTGVNHPTGKNLIGAFWQPQLVVSSQAVLQTLAPREVRCGLAEALKHGFLADPALVAWAVDQRDALAGLDPTATGPIVRRCCEIKAAVVAADERDHGWRAVLNLGHTFGHAFELLQGYGTLSHGEGVALGTVIAARLSEALGVAEAGLVQQVTAALDALGLPSDPEAPDLPPASALIQAARGDKKADHDGVRFILLRAFGQPVIRRLSWAEIGQLMAATPSEASDSYQDPG